ncbi:BTAD domain-containing putative transcriptional regulator [Kribbella capetownensis]|uniref:BTAD domain-containing putative transcriptional regulator n=1 Tax=Kribbella capetownensis TaxID=1572659 RepID=UPI0013F3E3CB|nr:BTAD domain-containing putative transcriptional regulator [Kribbella capetownensis]
MGVIRFELLGPLRARRDEETLDLGAAKQRAVLATLLVSANRPVSTARIVDVVWQGAPPANGANVVQKYIAGLRRVLEPERAPRSSGKLLTLTAAGYVLAVERGDTDVHRFDELVRQGHQQRAMGDLEEAAASVRSALSLWRSSEALAGISGPVFDEVRLELESRHADAAETWADLQLDLGRQASLLPDLSGLIERHPLCENLRAAQMLTLYRTGRQAEALEAYRATAQLLKMHGLTPTAQLQTLHNRLLNNSPDLLPTPDPSQQLTSGGCVRIDVLGPLRACRDGEPIDLGSSKQQGVLATLLLSANSTVTPERILAAVWPDDARPDNGSNVVQKYVAGLRKALDPDRAPRSAGEVLTLTDAGYRLEVPPRGSDLDEFTGRITRARELRVGGELERAAEELESALRLWRGEALRGFVGPVFDSARDRLNDDRASALEDHAEILLTLGRLDALIESLPAQINEFPLRERLRAVQMEALFRSGRRAEALAAYAEIRRLLVDQYGIEPSQDLQSLYARLLDDERSQGGNSIPAIPASALPDASWERAAAPRRTRGQRIRWKILAAALPILTWGFACGPMMGVLAWRRRSRLLGLAAIAYFALQWTGAVLFSQSPEDFSGIQDDIGMSLMIFPFLACSAHAAVIVAPASSAAERRLAGAHRRVAREIAARSPLDAQRLGIGRPDLPRTFDDGGLVDPNHVPAALLARVPGISSQHAALIVIDRTQRGPFTSLEDLSQRGLLPQPLPDSIADHLVIVDQSKTLSEAPE